MTQRFIKAKDVETDRITVESFLVKKNPKGIEYKESSIKYHYPCLDCFQNKDCKICGKECTNCTNGVDMKKNRKCSLCNKGITCNDSQGELIVKYEGLESQWGLSFATKPNMYGNGSINIHIDYEKESHREIFGDEDWTPGSGEGALRKIRYGVLRSIMDNCPSEYPKNSITQDFEDEIGVSKSFKLFKPHFKPPPTTLEIAADPKLANKSKSSSKFFGFKYFPMKKYTEGKTDDLNVTEKRVSDKIAEHKRVGLDKGENPVGCFTMTKIYAPSRDLQTGKLKPKLIPNFISLSKKNITFDAFVSYPSVSFVSKISVKEEIKEMFITESKDVEYSSLIGNETDIENMSLTYEQTSRMNKDFFSEGDETKLVKEETDEIKRETFDTSGFDMDQ